MAVILWQLLRQSRYTVKSKSYLFLFFSSMVIFDRCESVNFLLFCHVKYITYSYLHRKKLNGCSHFLAKSQNSLGVFRNFYCNRLFFQYLLKKFNVYRIFRAGLDRSRYRIRYISETATGRIGC